LRTFLLQRDYDKQLKGVTARRFPARAVSGGDLAVNKRLFIFDFNGPVGSVGTLEGLDGYGFWIWR
jgi:hypothetical protein